MGPLPDYGQSVYLHKHIWRQLGIDRGAGRERLRQKFTQDRVHLPRMAFFREIYMQHHDIGKRRAGFFKKFLDVRHRLPELLMDPFAEDTGMGVSTYLPSDREDVPALDCLRMGSCWCRAFSPAITMESIRLPYLWH